jgi:hypothetical protein
MSDYFKKDIVVRFTTKDGQLVMNRPCTRAFYFQRSYSTGEFTKELNVSTTNTLLESDARTKGVKILSYTHDENGIYAIVEWLSANTGKRK